jgi:hypothetical protein
MDLIYVIFYVYFAYCLMEIGKKLNIGDSWMAWVPIVNIYYSIKLAKRPGWWMVLFFIPLVNLAILIAVWREISKNLGFSKNLGWLIIVPILNLFLPGYLVFAKPSQAVSPATSVTPPPV